jgi:hypothetical protein
MTEATLSDLINGIEGKITPKKVVDILSEFCFDVTQDKVCCRFLSEFIFLLLKYNYN